MNRFYPIIVLLLSLVLTAACGNDGVSSTNMDSTSKENSTRETAQDQSGDKETSTDKAQTKTIVDALGRQVEIPEQPKSVVALWSVGEMLVLGQKPVGSSANLLRFYTEEQRSGIEVVGDNTEGSFEKVMSLQPDLIVLNARATEEDIDKYSKIAPTVTTPFFGDPFETFHAVAAILNKQNEAEQWIKNYQARVEEKQLQTRDLKLTEQSALVIQFAKKSMYTYRSSTFPVVFNDYQFKLSAKQEELQKEPNFGNLQLPMEVLPEFDADYIFVMISDDDSNPVYEELSQSEVWKKLKAARNNHVYVINNRMAINDVATMDWALEEIYSLLVKK
ncbi:ABC transporter substrate-binding protein [Paenibacillus barcinonensis]|uniref:iron-siderophore ABC transporter substrate-binding protein n=1 Tax=Paenibacillus barcinonensis TaxID=198119 RepID=UPI001C122025|nr:ABC transporter substrate-binding protein [Paenibacillus barcinonensis]MBU5354655.1 ABC transporter substrate-binding protein [Paenibacillus barcinonensis]